MSCQFQFNDLFTSMSPHKPLQPSLVTFRSDPDSTCTLSLQPFKTTQKCLISFCIQVPLKKENGEGNKSESVFKGSRLMMHEIIQDEEGNKGFEFNSDQGDSNDVISFNQRLEVIKITKCKMRAKDILEIEIGIKNMNVRDTQFE